MHTWVLLVGAAVMLAVCVPAGATTDSFGTGANHFTIDFVPISGGTNPTSGIPAGSGFAFTGVANDYRMGTYEITNDQWNKFTASLGLSLTGFPLDAYASSPQWTGPNVPTNNVSWYEAAQFVNWLNTSTGHHVAYNFMGTQGTSDYRFATWSSGEAAGGTNLYRHKDTMYFLPTENEWVKAAYWNGTSLQTYANASAGDLVLGVPDAAKWNYNHLGGDQPWDVGHGGQELNGTYDMMGNVWELMESPGTSGDYRDGYGRGMRAGTYDTIGAVPLASSFRFVVSSSYGGSPTFGFRVASGGGAEPIPEPVTMAGMVLGIGGLVGYIRRRMAR